MRTKLNLPKPLLTVLSVLRFLILACVAGVIGIDLYIAQSSLFLHDAMPMPFGYGMSVVLSGSMEPALSVDDFLLVREEESYAVGDMIVFRDGNSFTVHRLKEVNGDTFITRGDANNTDDSPISAKDVKGKVVKSVKGVGRLISAIRSPIGIVVMLGLAVALFEAPHFMREQKKREELEAIRLEIEKLKQEKE